jgi:hypothetical protein
MTAMPPLKADLLARGALWLLWFSTLNSNSYQTVSQRLGNALNASDLISGFISLPLETEQWKVEATRIFETSLARTQIDARNIARGVMAHYKGYIRMNDTPAQMCQVYLFRAQGLVNVNIVVSLMVLVPCVLTVVLAFPTFGEDILLETILRDSARPFGYYAICGILKIGNGAKLLFRLDTWTSIGGFVKGVFIKLPNVPQILWIGERTKLLNLENGSDLSSSQSSRGNIGPQTKIYSIRGYFLAEARELSQFAYKIFKIGLSNSSSSPLLSGLMISKFVPLFYNIARTFLLHAKQILK